MKFFVFSAAIFLSACTVPANTSQVADAGIPPLACTVASFTSDTGDARFNRGNSEKTFVITPTADGFRSDASSTIFSDSSTDFTVVRATRDRISTVRRGQTSNAPLNFSMDLDRAPTNGVWQVVQTMRVSSSSNPRGYTQNQWVMACRENR